MKNFNLPNGTIMKDIDDPKDNLCDACNGLGFIVVENPLPEQGDEEVCEECNGSGKKDI